MEAKWEGYPYTYSHIAPAPAGPITQQYKKVPSASAFASGNTTKANSAAKKVKPILKTGTQNMCGTVFLNASSGGEYKVGFPAEVVSDERGIWVEEAKGALKKSKVDEKRANKRKEKKEKKYRITKKKEKSSSSSSSSSISDSDSDSDSDASHTRRELEKLRRKLRKLKGEVGRGKTFRVVGGGGDMFTHATRATSEGVYAQGGLDINGTGWELENANANVNVYGYLGYAGGHARMSADEKVDEDPERIFATGKAKSKARTGRLWDEVLSLGAASMDAGIEGAGSAEVDASAAAQALINTVKHGHRIPPPSLSVPPPIQSEGTTGTNVDANIYTYHAESSEKSPETNGNPPAVPPKIHWQHYQNSREKSDQELQHILIDEESSHPCGGGIIPSLGVSNTHGPCTLITDTNGGGDARIQSQEQHHVRNYNHNHPPAPSPQLLSCIQYSAIHSHSQEDYAQQQHSYQCTNPHSHTHTHTHNSPSEADGHTHTGAHGCHDHGHGFCSYTYTLPEGWNTVQVTTMTSWSPVAPVAVMWGGWGWGFEDWYAP
ncbi:hypothetical protein BGX38DRAFT_1205014 [Terfezia claveryi]|nr:hypothetical protein BGX38DRAFT_1205014 [Terfezia claveryi]